ncbi:MAG: hypothetical protein CL779_00830 [Chloroflexi bacterium]|nr:hypothetical protein [Chloroflexota bacterium]
MAGAIQLTEGDFDEIKQNLINYLKSTKQFTDFDFDGSNLQVILNLISYQAQLNAYTANMVANESFLASASLRENVVSNAAMIGYVPVSARASKSLVSFEFLLDTTQYSSGLPQYLTIKPGMIFTTSGGTGNFIFNIVDSQNSPVSSTGVCRFTGVSVYEGAYLPANFVVDEADYNQEFVIRNSNIDTSTMRVEVQEDPNEDVRFIYKQAESLVTLTSETRAYWLEEVSNGFYHLTFGDGYFGKKLQNGAKIFVNYVVTNGELGNGVQGSANYIFVGSVVDSYGTVVTTLPLVTEAPASEGGAAIESIPSVKFRATKSYASQKRAVVASDYDSLVRDIYPAVDDIYVYGGDTLVPPQYGRVYISVKPSNSEYLSNITKNYIKQSLDPYRVASLDIVFVDPQILYIELVSMVYYNNFRTLKDNAAIVSSVKETLETYKSASSISKFGGSIKYSKIVGAIDASDEAITRNNTNLRMRRNIEVRLNSPATYEICFENPLKLDCNNAVVNSTGFTLTINGVTSPIIHYFKDDTKGGIYTYHYDEEGEIIIDNKLFGTVDYDTGEIELGYLKGQDITFATTVEKNGLIKVTAIPRDNDITVIRSVYMDLDIASSVIEATEDKQISGS